MTLPNSSRMRCAAKAGFSHFASPFHHMGAWSSVLYDKSPRARLPLDNLPDDALLRVARRLEVTRDILSLRASCKAAKAALDAPGWRCLTVLQYGKAATAGYEESQR